MPIQRAASVTLDHALLRAARTHAQSSMRWPCRYHALLRDIGWRAAEDSDQSRLRWMARCSGQRAVTLTIACRGSDDTTRCFYLCRCVVDASSALGSIISGRRLRVLHARSCKPAHQDKPTNCVHCPQSRMLVEACRCRDETTFVWYACRSVQGRYDITRCVFDFRGATHACSWKWVETVTILHVASITFVGVQRRDA